jgi:hypothetical protein
MLLLRELEAQSAIETQRCIHVADAEDDQTQGGVAVHAFLSLTEMGHSR